MIQCSPLLAFIAVMDLPHNLLLKHFPSLGSDWEEPIVARVKEGGMIGLEGERERGEKETDRGYIEGGDRDGEE